MSRIHGRARSATIESRALCTLKLASEASYAQARHENVPITRADFFVLIRFSTQASTKSHRIDKKQCL